MKSRREQASLPREKSQRKRTKQRAREKALKAAREFFSGWLDEPNPTTALIIKEAVSVLWPGLRHDTLSIDPPLLGSSKSFFSLLTQIKASELINLVDLFETTMHSRCTSLCNLAGSPTVRLRPIGPRQLEVSYTMPESEWPDLIAIQVADAIVFSLCQPRITTLLDQSFFCTRRPYEAQKRHSTSVLPYLDLVFENGLLLFTFAFSLAQSLDILLSSLVAMFPQDQHLTLCNLTGISRKRSHSDALGREDTRTHHERTTAYPSDYIPNESQTKVLDIRTKTNDSGTILDDTISDDENPHGDITTSPTRAHSTGNSSIIDTDPIDESLIDDGIEHGSTCSSESLEPGDIELETLWNRVYPINEWQPHDDQRAIAWDLSHSICLKLFGLCKTSIPPNFQQALDIGTVNGTWAMDFADENPHIKVTGIDLTDITPKWVPPNLSFQTVGCLGLGSFNVSSQDFIHLRDLKGRIGNWGEFAKEVFIVLKPGGVAEFHESNIEFQAKAELPKDSLMKEWGDLFREAGAKRGARFDVVESGLLLSSLQAAGFSDIEEYLYEVPIERWRPDGELGQLGWLERVSDIEGSILRPAVEDLKWTEEQCYMFAAGLRNELKKTTVKPYIKRLVVVCKKPST